MKGREEVSEAEVSAVERELFGGRLRWRQSFIEHEGALARMGFGQMAAALPRMVGLVMRAGWSADPRGARLQVPLHVRLFGRLDFDR